MKNPKLFKRTFEVLLKAYAEGNLIHQDVCACAIGNLVLDAEDHTDIHFSENNFMLDNNKRYRGFWYDFMIYRHMANINIETDLKLASEDWYKIFKYIGYSWQDIISIETAFEEFYTSDAYIEYREFHGHDSDASGYWGLLSILDALCIIHDVKQKGRYINLINKA